MQLERVQPSPLFGANPVQEWEAGASFNPSLLQDGPILRLTYRANRLSGRNRGEFRLREYMSSVGHGIVNYDEPTKTVSFERSDTPLIIPDQPYEEGMGCEDARLSKLDGTYILPYTAVGVNNEGTKAKIRIGLATSSNFTDWEKHGVIGPDETSKAATFFPRKIKDSYKMLYTLWSDSPQSSIVQAEFSNLDELIYPASKMWEENIKSYKENVVFEYKPGMRRGAEIGASPIETAYGWLLVYCPPNETGEDRWDIGAALLDIDDPRKVLASTDSPLLTAETDEEINAPICKKAVFPMGATIIGEDLLVAHGVGDTSVGFARINKDELVESLVAKI